MCKIGIIAIGMDLYHSAFGHFQTLLILLQTTTTPSHNESESSQPRQQRVLMDLAVHFLALATLVQAFRGRVDRRITGRVVFPVLLVKAAFVLDAALNAHAAAAGDDYGDGGGGLAAVGGIRRVLELAKGAAFLIITAKLAFGNDDSYVGEHEWFPNKRTDRFLHTC